MPAKKADATPKPLLNAHSLPVHIGDKRTIAPGEPIPSDVTADQRAGLLASGFFK